MNYQVLHDCRKVVFTVVKYLVIDYSPAAKSTNQEVEVTSGSFRTETASKITPPGNRTEVQCCSSSPTAKSGVNLSKLRTTAGGSQKEAEKDEAS